MAIGAQTTADGAINDGHECVAASGFGGCLQVSQVLARIGDKWVILVIMLLLRGPQRFSVLKREIGGISQRMLTLTLRNLERDGLVKRTVTAVVPPWVDYELTDTGRSLATPARALGIWAMENLASIERSRVDYDNAQQQSAA